VTDQDALWKKLPGAVVPFGWRAFADKYRLMWRAEGHARAVAGQMAARLALLAVSQAGWAADEVIARDWRDRTSLGPLFILGHQRSGTTLHHRLLACDRTHARALTAQEMIFPATSLQRAFAAVGAWDKKRGGGLAARLKRTEDRLFGPLDDLHRLRFGEIEEDEFVLWAIFASAMCANDSPSSTERRALDDLRHFDRWPEDRQARALGWYRACLLKKLQREPGTGGEPTWIVSKNPAFTHKVDALLKVFPDARFIYHVRNPLRTIASRLSLFEAIWQRRFPGFGKMTPRQVEVIVADSLRTYLSAEEARPKVPPERWIDVRYDDLTRDPRSVVESVYRHFDLPGPDENLRAELAKLETRTEPHRSAHVYDLAEFGLTEEYLREKLRVVFERYGF
jgi:hypothetical protein